MTNIHNIRWARHSEAEIARTRAQITALNEPGGLLLFFEPQEAGESLRHIVKAAVRDALHARLDALLTDLALAGFTGDGIPEIKPEQDAGDAPQEAVIVTADIVKAEPAIELTDEGKAFTEAAAKESRRQAKRRSANAARAAKARWDAVRRSARKAARTPVKKAAKKPLKRARR